MKSITQINLGFLTEMKSLSESDSGMLQASQLIASGGAGLVSRFRGQTEPPAREVTVFSSLHFNIAKASGISSQCQIKCKLACRCYHIWLNYSLKSLCAVFTIKMNNCHYIANFFCMNTQRCQDIHLKLMGWELDVLLIMLEELQKCRHQYHYRKSCRILSIAIITTQWLAIYICTCIWGTYFNKTSASTYSFLSLLWMRIIILNCLEVKSFMVISNW